MKAFECDGEVSREHHYIVFRNIATSEDVHFAIPKCVRMVDAIRALKSLLPDPWVHVELDDPTYERVEHQPDIDRWSRSFLTDMAVHASTQEVPA